MSGTATGTATSVASEGDSIVIWKKWNLYKKNTKNIKIGTKANKIVKLSILENIWSQGA